MSHFHNNAVFTAFLKFFAAFVILSMLSGFSTSAYAGSCVAGDMTGSSTYVAANDFALHCNDADPVIATQDPFAGDISQNATYCGTTMPTANQDCTAATDSFTWGASETHYFQNESVANQYFWATEDGAGGFTAHSFGAGSGGGNTLPALGGTFTTNGMVDDDTTISPFSSVTVSDGDGDNVSVSITFTGANGTLSGTGLTGSGGAYTVTSATPATAQSNLQGLLFTPTENQVEAPATVVTSFTLTPNDGTGDGASDATTQVTATSINDGPAIAGDLAVTVAQGGTVTLSTADLTENDVDDSGAGLTYTLQTDTATGTLFVDANDNGTVDGGEERSTGGTATFTQANIEANRLKYEHDNSNTNPDSFQVTLADGGEDGAAASGASTVNFTITGGNTAPSGISLTPNSIDDSDTGTNAVVGTLSQTDPDADTWTFSLVSAGTGTTAGSCSSDADNASFNISGTSLRTSSSLTFGTYSVCIQVSDGTDTFKDTLSISVDAASSTSTSSDDEETSIANGFNNFNDFVNNGGGGGGQSCPANASENSDGICECDAGFSAVGSGDELMCAAIPSPEITGVSIPDTAMAIGDVVTTTISVMSNEDTFSGLTGTVAGFPLENLSKVNNSTYTATFTVLEGFTDYQGSDAIPVSVTVTDSSDNTSAEFNAPISQDNDPIFSTPPAFNLFFSQTQIDEEGGTADLVVELSDSLNSIWPVDLEVLLGFTGTATFNVDFESPTTVTIPAFTSSGLLTLTALEDDVWDAVDDEVITANFLSAPVGAAGAFSLAQVTIDDAQDSPMVTLSVDNDVVSENGGEATVTATLNHPSFVDVEINLGFTGTATGFQDYTVQSPALRIVAGETRSESGSEIRTIDNNVKDSNRRIEVSIDTVSGGATDSGSESLSVVIRDDETRIAGDLTLDFATTIVGQTGDLTLRQSFTEAVSGITTVFIDLPDKLILGDIPTVFVPDESGQLYRPVKQSGNILQFTSTDPISIPAGETIPILIKDVENPSASGGTGAFTIELRDNVGIVAASDSAGVDIRQRPEITSATYDRGTGTMSVTGTNFVAKAGENNDVNVENFSFQGRDFIGISLVGAPAVEITDSTSFSFLLSDDNATAMNTILDKLGNTASDGTKYNFDAFGNWMEGANDDVENPIEVVDSTNQPPTAIKLTPNSVDTSAAVSFAEVSTISATDSDSESFTFDLFSDVTPLPDATGTCAEGDDANELSFFIQGDKLFVNDASLDAGDYKICIVATDDADNDFVQALTFTVTEPAPPPTATSAVLDFEAQTLTVTGTNFVELEGDDNDIDSSVISAIGPETLELFNVNSVDITDSTSFTLEMNESLLSSLFADGFNKNGTRGTATADYELFLGDFWNGDDATAQEIPLTVTGLETEAPTDITLTPTEVEGEVLIGSAVSVLSASDADTGANSLSFRLIDQSDSGEVCGDDADDGNSFFGINDENNLVSLVDVAAGTYNLCIEVSDADNNTFVEALVFTVTVLNDPPTAISLSETLFEEDDTGDGVEITQVIVEDPDEDDTFTFEFVDFDTDDSCNFADLSGNDLFTFAGDKLVSKAPIDPDLYALCVKVTDSGGETFVGELFVDVGVSLNRAPTSISFSPDSVDESVTNAGLGAPAVLAEVTGEDPNPGDAANLKFTLVSAADAGDACTDDSDNSLFTVILNRQLVSLGPLSAGQYKLCVQATDEDGETFVQQLLFTITTDVNQPPTDLSLNPDSIDTDDTGADDSLGAIVSTVSAIDPEGADIDQFTYELISSANSEGVCLQEVDSNEDLFRFLPGSLHRRLATTRKLDPGEYNICVKVTDTGSPPASYIEELIFTVTGDVANQPPTDIILSPTTIEEDDTGDNVEIGELVAADPNPNTTFEFSLAPANEDIAACAAADRSDNALFSISSNKLFSVAELAAGDYDLCIGVSDGIESYYEHIVLTIEESTAATVIDDEVSLPGETVTDPVISENGVLSDATIEGTVTNRGTVRNVNAGPGTTVVGGSASGTVVGDVEQPVRFNGVEVKDDTTLVNVILDQDSTVSSTAQLGSGVKVQNLGSLPNGLPLTGAAPKVTSVNGLLVPDPRESVTTDGESTIDIVQTESGTNFQADDTGTLTSTSGTVKTEATVATITVSGGSGTSVNRDGQLQIAGGGIQFALESQTHNSITATTQEQFQGEVVANLDGSITGFRTSRSEEVINGLTADPDVIAQAIGGVDVYYIARASYYAIEAPDQPLGLIDGDAEALPEFPSVYHVYDDDDGVRRRKEFLPWPVDWELLKNTVASIEGVTDVRINEHGIITVQYNGTEVQARADYEVQIHGPTEQTYLGLEAAEDFNGDGIEDVLIMYPNGDVQKLFMIF